MTTWLDRDIRWQQQKAIDARHAASQLRDEDWVRHEIAKRARERRNLKIRSQILAAEIRELRDADTRLREAQRHEDDANAWDRLAEEHERHRERREGAGLFDGEPS